MDKECFLSFLAQNLFEKNCLFGQGGLIMSISPKALLSLWAEWLDYVDLAQSPVVSLGRMA